MKLPESKLSILFGKNSSKNFYQTNLFFKDKIPDEFKESLNEAIQSKVFQAEQGQIYFDHSNKKLFIGLGEEEKAQVGKIANSFLKIGAELLKWKNVGLEIHLQKELIAKFSAYSLAYQIANSLEISCYPVDSLSKKYQERKIEIGEISFVAEKNSDLDIRYALKKSKIVSKYLNQSRYVEHLPANYFTPEEFVSRSKEIAKENKLKITVFDEDRLQKESFGGILSVCQGSDKKAKMIILEYHPKKTKSKKTLALVGKGLTFDSGGISLKPAAEMHEMKYDMCGAATAIHAIGAIASLGLEFPVIAAIGVAENMPDAAALKPGDVFTAYNGTTVEVQNTDAEGRLVLGDVLSYISKKYKPEYLLDLATLTGAVIIALGHEACGVMTNSEEFYQVIEQASTNSLDKVWKLPFWEEYAEDLKSDIADLRNITGGRAGGTLSAGQFLYKFVEKEIKFAHLDIAGTAWRGKSSGTQPDGPTGYGVRLLVDLVEELVKKT